MKATYEALQYPIGKETTTVGSVLRNLRLARGGVLRRAFATGAVTLDGQPVQKGRTRVAPGQTVGYQEYRITVLQDNTDKANRLLVEGFRKGGFNSGRIGGIGGSNGAFGKR